jgi:ornithine cyclodeaminase/alanine dehydrogenase-like protein (mu-crystallin family)
MPETIELMKTAFRELSEGRAISPLRTPIEVEEHGGVSLFMPASVPSANALGMKIVSVFPRNPENGLPTIHAVVALIDSSIGVPVAMMDGGYLTALRTGAVSGAATDLMARPDSKTLVVIGAGKQAETQAAAIAAVRPIERIVNVGRSEERLARFTRSFATHWPDLSDRVETTTNRGVVKDADVICTATTSKTPVFDDSELPDGVHINGVGSYAPDMQEIPSETVVRSRVVVDSFDAAFSEAGDLIKPVDAGLVSPDRYRTELGHLVAGTAIGRQDPLEVTFFKSVGNAIQDVIVARQVVTRALERGLGQEFDLQAE